MMKQKIDQIKEGLREFSITSWAVDNGTSVFILTIMILLFGMVSYNQMPKEQFPEASFPTVFVNTPYFGNSAKDIENLITRPIEKEIQNITGVKDVSSTSIQDFSVITVEFNADLEMDEVTRKVKDAVDLAKSELPTDLDSDPLVLEVNLSEIPIVSVNLSGEYPMDQLRKFAEYLEDKIEDIDEVSKVDIKGALEKEVKINVDLPKMQALQVTFQDIENAIASENMNMSGGELVKDDFRRAIRVVGLFENVGEIQDVIVKSEDQRPIYLREIAEVKMGWEERTSYARSDGFPVVSLDVIKRKGENLLNAADRIKVVVDEAQANYFPDDLNVTLFNDQSVNTRTQVDNLENSIISGVILVVIVLLFFLGIRNSMFVGIAIPLSMLMGILILHITGTTLNMVVLFSLILALGLLVDNGIVVVENIYRYMQNGYSNKDAAKYGAGEVAMPIIASTATTLAAFLPLAFWPGIMGEFMKYLPITLIIVLASSLFVALVINPVLTSTFMRVDKEIEEDKLRKRKRRNVLTGILLMILFAFMAHLGGILWMRNLLGIVALITIVNYFFLRPASFFFQSKILILLEKAYDRFIRAVLHRFTPIFVFVGTFLLLIFSFFLLGSNMPKVDFFPSADPIYINVFAELPLGKDIEATNRIMLQLEGKVSKAIEPYGDIVDAVLSQIGENTSDPNSPPEPGVTPHKARLTVAFVPSQDRGELSTRDAMEDIRESVKGYAGVQIVVDKNADGPPAGKPVNIELAGESIDSLAIYSGQMIQFINNLNIGGIEELKADVKLGKPELLIEIDREAARRYELSTFSIASAIRTSVFGKEVSKFKDGEDEYPIQLRLSDRYRYNVTDILNQKVTFRNPANGQIVQVPISSVADVRYSSTYSAIKRKNLKRVITVFSNVLEGYNANEIVGEIKTALVDFELPSGYVYEFTGEQQQQAEDMGFLTTAFGIAIFLIFIILVTQFNSISAPFLIIISVLFSLIGVLLGFVFSNMNISVIFTGIGIVSLAGIVVNNAIVLVDYIELLIKRKGKPLGIDNKFDMDKSTIKDAIIEGGATRLRPVLLTAITTVLGLIPLALGININFFTLITDLDPNYFAGGDNSALWGPMAWTVIFGLVFATFLTLVVVPAMYWLLYRMNLSVRNLGKKKQPVVATQTAS
jgi:multidrug efflux pump subunit AcrB